MVREFQSIIGREARAQWLERVGALPSVVVACVGGGSNAIGMFGAFLEAEGRLPEVVVACVGGGSNAIGMFAGFLADDDVRLVGVESGKHAASIGGGRVGVLHGSRSYVLQDEHGQIRETHSVSAGLDYPGVGPEHAFLHETGRVEYVSRTDAEALEAFGVLSRTEGIIPALEPAHAIADLAHIRLRYGAEADVLVCLSGRGDKDLETVMRAREAR